MNYYLKLIAGWLSFHSPITFGILIEPATAVLYLVKRNKSSNTLQIEKKCVGIPMRTAKDVIG